MYMEKQWLVQDRIEIGQHWLAQGKMDRGHHWSLLGSDDCCGSNGWTNILRFNFHFGLTVLPMVSSNTFTDVGTNHIIASAIVYTRGRST